MFSKIRFHVVRAFLLASLVAGVVGCASAPPPVVTQVQGNGFCHPSVDLPAEKHMTKVPATDTFMEDVFGLLLDERKAHADDQRDYNSLYQTCVMGK